MYLKKSHFVIFLSLAAVVGFGICLLVCGIGTQSGLTEGSIAKAARYNIQKEDPMISIIEEKLINDKEFLINTKNAISFLQDRMTILSELSQETIIACEGISEFEPLIIEMKSINAKAYNTIVAMEGANKSLDIIAEGKKAHEYESYSNQAYIGFSKVENQLDLGLKFCQKAITYIEGKDEEQYKPIADLIKIWELYCRQDAQIFEEDSQQIITSNNIIITANNIKEITINNDILSNYINNIINNGINLKMDNGNIIDAIRFAFSINSMSIRSIITNEQLDIVFNKI